MKKLISLFLFISSLVFLFPTNISASESGYFIVTAYYSPLPDQDYYITGSYESEKRLNGNGIAGASGKGVFSGMLAAPSKYGFGTKIKLNGLGVGSVEDRGGAIVPAGQRGYSHDRIDVWVGYGDEGLRRAMYWGKRKVAGEIVSSGTQTTLDYTSIPAPSWAVPQTTTLYGQTVQVSQTQNNSIPESDIFSLSLGKGSDSELISKLQETLKDIGYYNQEENTGIYDDHTIDAVYNFQINHEIVSDETTPGAGSFGPKTREKLKEIYSMHQAEQQEKEDFLNLLATLETQSKDQAEAKISELGIPKYGDISPQVRELQKLLSTIGVFDNKDTAIFGVKTQNALIEYQLENALVTNNSDIGAGTFGPKTRELLSKDLAKIYLDEMLQTKELGEKYNKYVATETQESEVKEEETIGFTIMTI